jgi:hypothetical protein
MYRLESKSAEPCTVDGYPAVQLLNSQQGAMTTHTHNATSAYLYGGQSVKPVRLTQGASAYFVLEWTHDSPNAQPCPTATYVRVTPPAGSGTLIASGSLDACGGNVTVSPVSATAYSGFAAAPPPPPTVTPTPTATATPTPTPTPTQLVSTTCRVSDLTLAQVTHDAGAGNVAILYSLTNGSSAPCTMEGYPTVRLLNADHQPLPTQQENTTHGYFYGSAQAQQVTVQPQGSAYFALEWTHIPAAGQTCPTAAVAEITPPGAHASLNAPGAIDACGGRITVSPVQGTQLNI